MDTTLLFTAGSMSFSHLVVAFVITPANAGYLLAGYNTMSELERALQVCDSALFDIAPKNMRSIKAVNK